MGLLAWIVIGLAGGLIFRSIVGNRISGTTFIAMVVGAAGAMLGGVVANAVLGVELPAFTFWSVLVSIVGTIALLSLYRIAVFRGQGRGMAS